MKNVYIYCEGQTEESFINEVLYPYFLNMDIFVYPIICTTKRTAAIKHRGGVSDYAKIRKELIMICRQHHHENVTTMFDYYAMPDNTPGIHDQTPDLYERIEKIESIIDADIAQANCTFHFMLHEFEGLLFSKPEAFGLIANNNTVEQIRKIRDDYPTPEHINNAPQTAPSKRLEALIPNYAKILDGTRLAKEIGIDVLAEQCPHFEKWIRSIAAMRDS